MYRERQNSRRRGRKIQRLRYSFLFLFFQLPVCPPSFCAPPPHGGICESGNYASAQKPLKRIYTEKLISYSTKIKNNVLSLIQIFSLSSAPPRKAGFAGVLFTLVP